MDHGLLGFALVALVLVLTPGPDFAVVVPNALRSRRAGVATALGTATGLAMHALIAALGLSAIVLASDVAFSVVKYVGVAFLVLLGIRAIWQSRSAGRREPSSAVSEGSVPPLRASAGYRQGFLVNVLNPKAPLIYLSVMPQFTDPGADAFGQLMAMSVLLVGIALVWYLLLTMLVGVLRRTIERFRHWIDRVTGVVLIALGLRLALETRPA
jgi:threonine/homoserine/homoserine lactone efflux protein